MKLKIGLGVIAVVTLSGLIWGLSLVLKPKPARFIDLTPLNRPNEIGRFSIIRIKEELKPFPILLIGSEQNPFAENLKQALLSSLYQYSSPDYGLADLTLFKTPEELITHLQSGAKWIVIGPSAELNAIQKSAWIMALEKNYPQKFMAVTLAEYNPQASDCAEPTLICLGSRSFKTFRNKKRVGARTAFFLERHRFNQFILFYHEQD